MNAGPSPAFSYAALHEQPMFRALIFSVTLMSSFSSAAESVTDTGAKNLRALEHCYDLGKKGDYQAQAAMWSADAINQGRPMKPDAIGSQLEDIHRTFPDFETQDLETKVVGDTMIVVLQRATGTHKGIARTAFYGGLLAGAKPTSSRPRLTSQPCGFRHAWRR
jgi:hypothetical protein